MKWFDGSLLFSHIELAVFFQYTSFLSVHEWIEKLWSMYTVGYSSAIRNDKYPPFASMWMELEGMMLSEVSQSEKDKHYMVSFIWGI